jgi:hypothetical protein
MDKVVFGKQQFVGKVQGAVTTQYQMLKVNTFLTLGNRIRQLRKSLQSEKQDEWGNQSMQATGQRKNRQHGEIYAGN